MFIAVRGWDHPKRLNCFELESLDFADPPPPFRGLDGRPDWFRAVLFFTSERRSQDLGRARRNEDIVFQADTTDIVEIFQTFPSIRSPLSGARLHHSKGWHLIQARFDRDKHPWLEWAIEAQVTEPETPLRLV